ncbi:class A beta-lactamase-related serine hydrolase, partial [Mesorhizobium sp. M7A.F.Ca.CA.001.10.2.1]
MREDLNALLKTYLTDGAVGASLAYSTGAAPTALTAGLADREHGIAVSPDRLFKIGSCTKTFVAAALVKLAQDGKLDLGAPIASWFPDLPGAEDISV